MKNRKNTKHAFHLLLCAANKLKPILLINEVTIELSILSSWIYMYEQSSPKPLMFISCKVSISQFLCFMHQLKKLSTEWFVNPYWQWWICVNLVSMATVNTCQTSSVIYHLLGTRVILGKGLICLSVLKHCVLSSSLLEASCATVKKKVAHLGYVSFFYSQMAIWELINNNYHFMIYQLSIVILLILIIDTKNKVYALVDDDKLSIADVVCKSCIYSKTRL